MARRPAQHERLFPDPARRRTIGRARRGLDVTVRQLRAFDRTSLTDEALIALARIAADQLDQATADDDESRYVRGQLIGRYREVLDMLYRTAVAADADDDIDRLLADLFDPEATRPAD